VRLLHAGILVTAKALLDGETRPSRDRIREALSGNLCRCTGYQQIVEAVEAAAERCAAVAPKEGPR
jgi:carbon-monoxide dehydrogenase small subunit